MSVPNYLALNSETFVYVRDNTIKYKLGGTSSDEYNIPLAGIGGVETITTNGPHVLTAADSGKLFVLHKTGGITIILPSAASSAGLRYTFVIRTSPTAGNHTITTTDSEDTIHGPSLTGDVDAEANTGSSSGDACDQISFAQNKSVIGDKVEVICDGTYWYATAYSSGPYDAVQVVSSG